MKTVIKLLFVVIFFAEIAEAQTASGRSKPGSLLPATATKDTGSILEEKETKPPSPIGNVRLPELAASITFLEPSGNRLLDAGEAGKLDVEVSNVGYGTAYGLQVRLTPETDTAGLTIGSFPSIDSLSPGSKEVIEIPIAAREDITSKQVRLQVEVAEARGFDLDPPTFITFGTRTLLPPHLVVADVGIDDQNKNGQIEPKEIVDITLRVQNKGEAEARNVIAKVQVGENVFFTPESRTEDTLGNLARGAYRDVTFEIYTNNRASGVPITLALTESRGLYGATIPVNLPFNKPQKKSTELVVEGKGETNRDIENVATLSVDVDDTIPTGELKNPDAIAIILGIEEYEKLPMVSYADRDASVFRGYAKNVFGIPDDNDHIYFGLNGNVTKAIFEKLFAEDGWLANRVEPGSDVYIFYAGHGAPDIKEKTPYLMPYDGDANYPTQTGYALSLLYENLGKLKVHSVSVFLDACFSGQTRESKSLLAESRPIAVIVENPILTSDKITVFSASTGSQISSGYPEKRHGLFTYFLLKGLQGKADLNHDKTVTVQEMDEYLSQNVKKAASRLDREQTPQVMGKDKQRVLVKY